jgi:hypothetical protein
VAPSFWFHQRRIPRGTSYLICGLDPPFSPQELVCADELLVFSDVHFLGRAELSLIRTTQVRLRTRFIWLSMNNRGNLDADRLMRAIVLSDAAPFVLLAMIKRRHEVDYGAKAVYPRRATLHYIVWRNGSISGG